MSGPGDVVEFYVRRALPAGAHLAGFFPGGDVCYYTLGQAGIQFFRQAYRVPDTGGAELVGDPAPCDDPGDLGGD